MAGNIVEMQKTMHYLMWDLQFDLKVKFQEFLWGIKCTSLQYLHGLSYYTYVQFPDLVQIFTSFSESIDRTDSP